MKENRIEQALTALNFALQEQAAENPLNNPGALVDRIPKRSLSGDHINGGTIVNFKSTGITDSASKEQIVIKDGNVTINNLTVPNINNDVNIKGNVSANNVNAGTITADNLHVKNITTDVKYENSSSVIFDGGNGMGIVWKGKKRSSQFVFNRNPDKIFSSEDIDLAKGRSFSVNNLPVLSEDTLGSTVVNSNIRTLGRLRELNVDGGLTVNNYMYYDSNTDRLGIGTDEPNGAMSIAEDGIEVIVGTKDLSKGYVGTYASHGLELVTDNTARISISPGGNIKLGNDNHSAIQVSVHGKLAIGVATPDPNVDLHVKGSVRFNDTAHMKGTEAPRSGVFNQGDIVWNSNPTQRGYIGWVCIQGGNPGIWSPFGEIR